MGRPANNKKRKRNQGQAFFHSNRRSGLSTIVDNYPGASDSKTTNPDTKDNNDNNNEIHDKILCNKNDGSGRTEKQEEKDEVGFSESEIINFERDGFVLLKGVFSRRSAKEGVEVISDILKTRYGIDVHDKKTWVKDRQGIPECFDGSNCDYPFVKDILSSQKLGRALDQLCGRGNWKSFGLGWWIMSFPGFHSPPWDIAGHWHVDGAHYVHHVNSAESGVVALFCFNDILSPTTGGGTAIAKGSHHTIANILMNSEPYGMKSKQLNKAAIDAVLGSNRGSATTKNTTAATDSMAAVETEKKKDSNSIIHPIVGKAGDVIFLHPCLLHARSKNLGESIRFMCNPNISLKKPMQIPRSRKKLKKQVERDGGNKMSYTPVERASMHGILSHAVTKNDC